LLFNHFIQPLPTAAYKWPIYPCSQCAQHSAIQKGDTGLTSSAGCQVSIEKKYNNKQKRSIPKAIILCKVLGKVEYIIANDDKSTVTNPFTNVPIACPECKHFISKYSFELHWSSFHSSQVKSEDLVKQLELDEKENANQARHFMTHLQRPNTTRPVPQSGCAITTTTTTTTTEAEVALPSQVP
jgi:hypothetical protein